MKIEVTHEPQDVRQGTVVRLTASTPSAATYSYRWYAAQGAITPATEPNVAFWNSAGLAPGPYKLTVEAELDPPDQKNADRRGRREFTLDVLPGAISVQDIETLATGARTYADKLKENFDGKMDDLTKEVSKVATGVGVLAESAPPRGEPLKIVLQRSATQQTARKISGRSHPPS